MNDRDSRAKGTLWGQACGDALGTTVEFSSRESIAARPASAWPGDLIGGGTFRLLAGQVTDDTELALALARSLVRMKRYDADDVATSYVRWFDSEPFDVGGATTQAFGSRVPAGARPALVVSERASKTTEANGSVMRVSPLGVFGAGMDRNELGALARGDSRLSHPADVPSWSSAIFTTTIADAIETGLDGKALYERALEFAREHAPKDSLLADTLLAAKKELPVSDLQNQGWIRIAMLHAYFHLWHEHGFEEALAQTVRMGGDADTNGAIVGALLGAVYGEDAIPARWRETVRDCLPERPVEYRPGDLSALAMDLLSARR